MLPALLILLTIGYCDSLCPSSGTLALRGEHNITLQFGGGERQAKLYVPSSYGLEFHYSITTQIFRFQFTATATSSKFPWNIF